jgi:hypothetical protein
MSGEARARQSASQDWRARNDCLLRGGGRVSIRQSKRGIARGSTL